MRREIHPPTVSGHRRQRDHRPRCWNAGRRGAQIAQATQATPPAGAPLQDVVLTNGRIHTMDARNTVASSVTIRNGRIAAVGGNPPSGVKVVDLRGRTVVPGLIEGHVHIVSLANRPGYHTILENTTSIREIQEALAARREERAGGPVDHVDGRLASEPVGRASASDAQGTRRSGSRPAGPALRAIHGPGGHQQHGQEAVRRHRRGRARSPRRQEGGGCRQRRHRALRASRAADRRPARSFICGACRPSTTRSAARSTR